MNAQEISNYRFTSEGEIFGKVNRVTVRRLLVQSREKSIHRPVLLTGPIGVGKTSLARYLAMNFNCETPQVEGGDPCGTCNECLQVGPEAGGNGYPYAQFEIDCGAVDTSDKMSGLLDTLIRERQLVVFWDQFSAIAELPAGRLLEKFVEDFARYRQGVNIIAETVEIDAAPKSSPDLLNRCTKIRLAKPTIGEMKEALAFYGRKFEINLTHPGLLDEMATRSNRSFRSCFEVFAAASKNPGRVLDVGTLDECLPRIRASLLGQS